MSMECDTFRVLARLLGVVNGTHKNDDALREALLCVVESVSSTGGTVLTIDVEVLARRLDTAFAG